MPAPTTKSLSRRTRTAGEGEGAGQTIRCRSDRAPDGTRTGGAPSPTSPVSPVPASPDAHVETYRATLRYGIG